MDSFTRDALKVFKALSDGTRYEMVRMLVSQAEVSCAQFAQRFRKSAPALSHHYRVLENCGLMETRKEGVYTFCRLNRAQLERYLPEFCRVHVDGHRGQGIAPSGARDEGRNGG